MMSQYNKNVRYYEYYVGDKVWVRKRHYKPGENRKLSPRYMGPYEIVRKMPNGVNYKIRVAKGKESIIHHNRLKKYSEQQEGSHNSSKDVNPAVIESEEVCYDLSDGSLSGEEEDDPVENARRYPLRNRPQRVVDGAVSWDVIDQL